MFSTCVKKQLHNIGQSKKDLKHKSRYLCIYYNVVIYKLYAIYIDASCRFGARCYLPASCNIHDVIYNQIVIYLQAGIYLHTLIEKMHVIYMQAVITSCNLHAGFNFRAAQYTIIYMLQFTNLSNYWQLGPEWTQVRSHTYIPCYFPEYIYK
jgi:hypothetical protein